MVLTALGAAYADPANAQGSVERERASIVFGAFITDRRTETRLDSDSGLGTDFALEDDLGLDSSTTVFRLGGDIWFGQRHRFDASLFDFSRSASKRIDETIEFGDEVYAVDTVVNSQSDLSILKADYTFAVVSRRRGYLGLTGGLYIADTKLSLSEPDLGLFESADLTAPLPVIGIRGEFAVTNRFTVRGASQWFSIDVADASGSLRDLYLGMDYGFGQRFAIGLAYNEVTMNITAEDTGRFEGEVDWGYDGWLAYLKVDFGRD